MFIVANCHPVYKPSNQNSSSNPTRHLTSVKFEDAPGAQGEGEEEGESAAAEKKISAEELFESVCSLKAAGTQMQLQDGESGFDPEMKMIRSLIKLRVRSMQSP